MRFGSSAACAKPRFSLADDILDPGEGGDPGVEAEGRDSEQRHVADFVRADAFGQRLPRVGVHDPLGAAPDSERKLDEAACARRDRPRLGASGA